MVDEINNAVADVRGVMESEDPEVRTDGRCDRLSTCSAATGSVQCGVVADVRGVRESREEKGRRRRNGEGTRGKLQSDEPGPHW